MSTTHGDHTTGAHGDDPWAPVGVPDDPWASPEDDGAAWVTGDDSAWSDGGVSGGQPRGVDVDGLNGPGSDGASSADAEVVWSADQSASAWADPSDDTWRAGGRSGVSRTGTGRAGRRASSADRGPGTERPRARTSDDASRRRQGATGATPTVGASGSGTSGRRPARTSRTTAEPDAPVSLDALAGMLTTASALRAPTKPEHTEAQGSDAESAASDEGRTDRQRRVAAMLAERAARDTDVAPNVGDPVADVDTTRRQTPPHPEPSQHPEFRPRRSARRGRASDDATDMPAPDTDDDSLARTIVLRQLTAAPRSRYQLAEALAKKDIPEDVAERVLDRFTEVGLIDDAAYAEMLVRSRHAERGLSRRALTQELRRKGVSPELAAVALEQVGDDDEESAARALARKKLRSTRGLDREVRMRRAYGALGRKGYGAGIVSRVVREELAAEEAAETD